MTFQTPMTSRKWLKLVSIGQVYHASATSHIPKDYELAFFIGYIDFFEALRIASAGAKITGELCYVLNMKGESVVAMSPCQVGGFADASA